MRDNEFIRKKELKIYQISKQHCARWNALRGLKMREILWCSIFVGGENEERSSSFKNKSAPYSRMLLFFCFVLIVLIRIVILNTKFPPTTWTKKTKSLRYQRLFLHTLYVGNTTLPNDRIEQSSPTHWSGIHVRIKKNTETGVVTALALVPEYENVCFQNGRLYLHPKYLQLRIYIPK